MEKRRALVLLLPEVHLQDMAGPVQALYESGRYELVYCAETRAVRSAQGLMLSELKPLPGPRAEDLVLIPGYWSGVIGQKVPVRWLRAAHDKGARLASVCSAAFALAQAGLLDGRRCTTHWKRTAQLQRDYPRARVEENCLYVEDGRIVTSAGVASGIDMALFLLEQEHGPLVAAQVAREMVVYLRRSGERAQQSVYLDHRTHLHPGVHRVQDFIVQHPQERKSAAELARLAGMSERNLTRVFRRLTGVTPHQFAARVKLQVARDLLGDPQRSLQGIAQSCGFEDARQLRRLWRQHFGESVRETRERSLS